MHGYDELHSLCVTYSIADEAHCTALVHIEPFRSVHTCILYDLCKATFLVFLLSTTYTIEIYLYTRYKIQVVYLLHAYDDCCKKCSEMTLNN